MKRQHLASILVGALIGLFYWWVLVHFWNSHSVDNSFQKWLLTAVSPREHLVSHRVLIYSYDVMLNVLLAVPFASMVAMSAVLNRWLSIGSAVLVMNVASYWGAEWGGDPALITFWTFWFGLGVSLLSLPLAFLIVRSISSRWLNTQSYGPMPHRTAA